MGLPLSKRGFQIFSNVVSSTADGTLTGLGLDLMFVSSEPDAEALLSLRLVDLGSLLVYEAFSEGGSGELEPLVDAPRRVGEGGV